MAKTYDNVFSRLIDDHLADWAAYLAERIGLPPGPATAVETDLSSNLQADRLIRVAGPEPALIHLELESSSRLGLPDRLLSYNVAAWRTSGEPVRSVLMLLRPAAQASDQTGRLTLSHGGVPYLTFDYLVIRLWQESPNALLAGGPGLAPLALLTDAARDNLDGVFAKFLGRLHQPDVAGTMRQDLVSSSYILSGLRYDPVRIVDLFRSYVVTLEDSSTYMEILRKGESRGEVKGLSLGKAEGLRVAILKVGTKRFGVPASSDRSLLAAVDDADVLERLFDRLDAASSWPDLLVGGV